MRTRPNTHTYTKKPTKKQMEGIWKWVGKPSHNNITHGNILSMENKHKKLFVIYAVKGANLYLHRESKKGAMVPP